MNKKFGILARISLMCVFRGPIDNKTALVQVMAWCWGGNNTLPEPMLIQFTDADMQHLGGRWIHTIRFASKDVIENKSEWV